MIAAGVRLITHDAAFTVLNRLERGKFPEKIGCIEIMDNVFIGYNSTILPNVRIGGNVIVGVSSTVTKDLEPGGVYAGCPTKRIGSFEDYVQKSAQNTCGGYSYPYVEHNQKISEEKIKRAWEFFDGAR
jgi:acetyltransferase-like isoleucine patch superfamily enzyme